MTKNKVADTNKKIICSSLSRATTNETRCNIFSHWLTPCSAMLNEDCEINTLSWARFLSLAQSKLRLCSANHRAGYFSNLACDWLSRVWVYSKQETENEPRSCHPPPVQLALSIYVFIHSSVRLIVKLQVFACFFKKVVWIYFKLGWCIYFGLH